MTQDIIKQLEDARDLHNVLASNDLTQKQRETIIAETWETIQAVLKVTKTLCEDGEWLPIEEAPKDGTLIILRKYHTTLPEFYSAWWMKGEKYEAQDGIEYYGHYWILNDDKDTMIEEDENLSLWSYRPLELNIEQLIKKEMGDA